MGYPRISFFFKISGETGGGTECPPETSDREISADLSGKKRQGKNGKWGKWRRKVGKEGKLLNGWREKLENEERTFFLLLFCFSLFKTTKISFWCTKMAIFYLEKGFHAGKKIRKNDFAPSEKNSYYAPDQNDCNGCKRGYLNARGHFVLRFSAIGDKPLGRW